MKVLTPGHVYEVDHLDGSGKQNISFVNRNPGFECEGTTNQELLRVLINRIKFLDDRMHWELNEQIIYHLRMAIALHEARAMVRKVEKNQLKIESLQTGLDGHVFLVRDDY